MRGPICGDCCGAEFRSEPSGLDQRGAAWHDVPVAAWRARARRGWFGRGEAGSGEARQARAWQGRLDTARLDRLVSHRASTSFPRVLLQRFDPATIPAHGDDAPRPLNILMPVYTNVSYLVGHSRRVCFIRHGHVATVVNTRLAVIAAARRVT
jgi:hypothetical protein